MADICDPDQPSKPRPLVAPKPTAKDRLAWLASTVSEGIQSRYGVTPSELAWSSPNRLEGVPEPQLWRVFLSTLYRPDDVVWIGDKTDSGQPHHASNFRRVSEWLESEPAGRLVSLSTFKAGSVSRGNDSIDQHRFIVLESDSLPISKQPAAINFCREFAKLKAIVHSGNKSLHAWFERPADDVLDELKVILPALGIDLAGTVKVIDTRMNSGNFVIVFSAMPGTKWHVQKTASLASPFWTDIGTDQTADSNGYFQITDPVGSAGSGFYEAYRVP